MIEVGIARRYVRALFELSFEEGVTYAKRVLSDLQWFEAVLNENEDFRLFLVDPRESVDKKKQTLEKILPEGLQDLTRDFLVWVTEKGRAEMLSLAAGEYEALLQDEQQLAVAEVQSAAKLDSDTRDALVEKLESVTQRKIKLVASVDAGLLGGMRIRLGGSLYDGTLKRQLEDLRGELLQVRLPAPEAFDFPEDTDGAAEATEEDNPAENG